MVERAKQIIGRFGGAVVLAGLLGINPLRVYRLTWPVPRGTGGRIPHEMQQRLLDLAAERDIDLTPADFFDRPEVPARESTETAA